ncbi:TSCOT protein, partial [Amia calva]|nr:TSCOT protein [Amia calva]
MSFRTLVEPVVVAAQLASALYDTGLQMVVKERCNVTTSSNTTAPEDQQQKAISNFYMVYNMISSFVPFLPAIFLARIGDQRRSRKIPISVPLVGYFLSRALLLIVILFQLPIQVMFGGAILYGLGGGFSSYWAGVFSLVSERSNEAQRSLHLIRIELAYGIAGFVGSVASGHLFMIYSYELRQGVLLVGLSVIFYLFCLTYTLCVLKFPQQVPSPNNAEESNVDRCLSMSICLTFDKNIILLFAAAILYDISVGGALEILTSFVMKEPLSWGAAKVGYGNAFGFAIYITSFLGVLFFSRYFRDTTMIIIGIVSFGAGIFGMSFVTTTYGFFIARTLNMFALIPMPTIRSLLSKQVQGSSLGKVLISMQLSFTLASVIYSPIFTKIYQATLDWFAGFVFTLSFILSCLAIIPIWIVGYRTARQQGYERIS